MYTKASMDWESWQIEQIHWRGAVSCPRAYALRKFVKEGLIPFLEAHGYRIGCSAQEFASKLATGLYENAELSCVESDWRFGELMTEWVEEDIWQWQHVISDEEWEYFWSIWGEWTDVNPELSWRGQDRRVDIQAYCWTQIDLENSAQTTAVNEMMGYWESDEQTSGTAQGRYDDIYLKESAESGQWGGYRR